MMDSETFEMEVLYMTHTLNLKQNHPQKYRYICGQKQYKTQFSQGMLNIKGVYSRTPLTEALIDKCFREISEHVFGSQIEYLVQLNN